MKKLLFILFFVGFAIGGYAQEHVLTHIDEIEFGGGGGADVIITSIRKVKTSYDNAFSATVSYKRYQSFDAYGDIVHTSFRDVSGKFTQHDISFEVTYQSSFIWDRDKVFFSIEGQKEVFGGFVKVSGVSGPIILD